MFKPRVPHAVDMGLESRIHATNVVAVAKCRMSFRWTFQFRLVLKMACAYVFLAKENLAPMGVQQEIAIVLFP